MTVSVYDLLHSKIRYKLLNDPVAFARAINFIATRKFSKYLHKTISYDI